MKVVLPDGSERDVDRDDYRVLLDGRPIERPIRVVVGAHGSVRMVRGADDVVERGAVEVYPLRGGTVWR